MNSLDNTIYCILANITWNSKDWEDVSDDKSSHRWVVAGGTPHESWNFDLDNPRNPVDKIYGYVQFTHAPKIKNKKTLIIFYSDSKIVGFYGNATIYEKPIPINSNESYNIEADYDLSLVLRNKIENVKAKGYFGDRERVGMVGFIYLKEIELINKILEEAISLNPEDYTKLKSIKEWLNSSGTYIAEEQEDNTFTPKNYEIPLNQIFYGPPGTGKTYNTINEAIKIVEELDDSELKKKYPTREALKIAFQGYLNEEEPHIGFCTFHQSFSYEDFIEGIKPLEPTPNDTYLKYDIIDGIFKKMSNNADSWDKRKSLEIQKIKATEDLPSFAYLTGIDYTNESFYKVSLGDSTSEDDKEIYEYCINNNKVSIGWGGEVNLSKFGTEKEIYEVCKEDEQPDISSRFASYFKLYLKVGNYVVISNGNTRIRAIGKVTGEYEFLKDSPIQYHHFRSVKWLIKDIDIPVKEFYDRLFQQQTIYKLKNQNINPAFFLNPEQKTKIEQENIKPFRNHVLIIDEINRGNISQIFGELITLIEEDKRKGNNEELQVILPYSKKKFYVPSNLFIIGTMNTADRSIEALDTALRRRFCFKEMMPLYDLFQLSKVIYGVSLEHLLQIINDRIEKLVDRYHLIGHSYFLNIVTGEDLMIVFRDKIIPLLQEYFYGNYEKMGLVLGKGFVDKLSNTKVIFADFTSEDFDYNEKIIYRLNKESFKNEENFKSALLTLLNNKKEIIVESE